MILATRPFGSVTLYSQARARDQSRDASPPSRVTIVAAYCFCPVRASVRSRPQRVRSMMGFGEARSSKLTARA
jgi:hypothetical protein